MRTALALRLQAQGGMAQFHGPALLCYFSC